jgi:hypothetical protein
VLLGKKCKDVTRLEDAEQARLYKKAEKLGKGAGDKEHATTETGLEAVFGW